jgi:hypothetical protein
MSYTSLLIVAERMGVWEVGVIHHAPTNRSTMGLFRPKIPIATVLLSASKTL